MTPVNMPVGVTYTSCKRKNGAFTLTYTVILYRTFGKVHSDFLLPLYQNKNCSERKFWRKIECTFYAKMALRCLP